MANEQNLIPNEMRTPEERRKNARKAGIASGKARKRKKIFKDILEDIGTMNCNPDEIKKIIKQYVPNIDDDDLTYNYALMISMFHRGIVKGNAKCAEFIRDTIGQKPIEHTVVAFDENNELIIDLGEEEDIEEDGTDITEKD